MTAPHPSQSGPDEFEPVYAPPAWYLENAQQASDTKSPPWHSVSPTFPPPRGCAVCGVSSAEDVTIRAHQGLIFFMRWSTVTELLCRVCGVALVRSMTTRTLWQGWWGVGSLVVGAPFALLANLQVYRRLRRLPLVAPASGVKQLDLGKPVLQRPLAYVALIPMCWAVWLITAVVNG